MTKEGSAPITQLENLEMKYSVVEESYNVAWDPEILADLQANVHNWDNDELLFQNEYKSNMHGCKKYNNFSMNILEIYEGKGKGLKCSYPLSTLTYEQFVKKLKEEHGW